MSFKRFNTMILAGMLLLSAIGLVIYERYVEKQIENLLIDSIRHDLYNLALYLNEHFDDKGTENMRIMLDRTKAGNHAIAALCVVDKEGHILLKSGYGARRRLPPQSKLLPIKQLDAENIADTDLAEVGIYRLKGLQEIPYRLVVKLNREYIRQTIGYLRWMQILLPTLFILLFFGAYLLMYRVVFGPLMQLDAYICGESDRIPHSPIDEIEHLTRNSIKQIGHLRDMAYYDVLTGVQNRRSIERSLDQAIAAARRDGQKFSIAMLDLDRFKEVNDTYGHDIGDKLLVEMVHRIRKHLREVDRIGRMGGDEFLIIFHHDEHPENILSALERIRVLFEEPFAFEGLSMVSTLSIGVAIFGGEACTRTKLLKAADQAMYRAKKSGGNAIVEAERKHIGVS